MPMAGDTRGAIGTVDPLRQPPIARACQHHIELAADQLFDKFTDPFADGGLDRIEPIVEKLGSRLGSGCEESGFVVMLVMAWSPVRRSNAG